MCGSVSWSIFFVSEFIHSNEIFRICVHRFFLWLCNNWILPFSYGTWNEITHTRIHSWSWRKMTIFVRDKWRYIYIYIIYSIMSYHRFLLHLNFRHLPRQNERGSAELWRRASHFTTVRSLCVPKQTYFFIARVIIFAYYNNE